MSTPPFLESPRFPDNIAFGATVGPTYQTIVTPITSGRDGRIVQWTQARIRFEVGMRSMLASVTAQLDAYFRSVKVARTVSVSKIGLTLTTAETAFSCLRLR
jgi:uncharacterized protein (TIGR02217 family)